MKQYRKLKGFTLIEMIIVLAIMGILIGILAPTMSTYYWKSRVKDANADAKMVYNATQTAVQKYISIDRMKKNLWSASESIAIDKKSIFSSGYGVIIEYNATTRMFTLKTVEKNPTVYATMDHLSVSVDKPIDTPAVDGEDLYQKLVSDILKTVSDADMTNWAVYVDGYIVEAAVSANSRGTRNIGYYTNGTITVERADGSYESEYVKLLCDYARTNGYNLAPNPPVLPTEAP